MQSLKQKTAGNLKCRKTLTIKFGERFCNQSFNGEKRRELSYCLLFAFHKLNQLINTLFAEHDFLIVYNNSRNAHYRVLIPKLRKTHYIYHLGTDIRVLDCHELSAYNDIGAHIAGERNADLKADGLINRVYFRQSIIANCLSRSCRIVKRYDK